MVQLVRRSGSLAILNHKKYIQKSGKWGTDIQENRMDYKFSSIQNRTSAGPAGPPPPPLQRDPIVFEDEDSVDVRPIMGTRPVLAEL